MLEACHRYFHDAGRVLGRSEEVREILITPRRAVKVELIITGNMDEEGGMMFPLTAIDSLSLAHSSWNRYRSRVSGRPEFSGELPMAVIAEEILTPGEGQLSIIEFEDNDPEAMDRQLGIA